MENSGWRGHLLWMRWREGEREREDLRCISSALSPGPSVLLDKQSSFYFQKTVCLLIQTCFDPSPQFPEMDYVISQLLPRPT